MSTLPDLHSIESQSSKHRIHVIGAGPVGLLLTALLQSSDRFAVSLYEKRRDYTRTRMVQLAPYLVADSVASYSDDYIDGESVEAIFETSEILEGLAFRQSISPDLLALLRSWTMGFCPLNAIERSLSDLIDQRQSHPVKRTTVALSAEDAIALQQPGDVLIDCTGANSLLRDHLGHDAVAAGNTFRLRLEYALVVTFLYDRAYDCNEYCKYYKNIDNAYYKFIPAVNRTYYDGSITHVTGIINIPAEDYDRMPPRFDGESLRTNFPYIAQSMDRFLTKIRTETSGTIVGDLEIIRIPLNLYRARNSTNREIRRGVTSETVVSPPIFLVGDSAMGSPYFQSISLGFECAMFLAGLLSQQDVPVAEMLDRYERYTYKQWLRVYMRSKMIKHNKDLFESVGDTFTLLEKLHIY